VKTKTWKTCKTCNVYKPIEDFNTYKVKGEKKRTVHCTACKKAEKEKAIATEEARELERLRQRRERREREKESDRIYKDKLNLFNDSIRVYDDLFFDEYSKLYSYFIVSELTAQDVTKKVNYMVSVLEYDIFGSPFPAENGETYNQALKHKTGLPPKMDGFRRPLEISNFN